MWRVLISQIITDTNRPLINYSQLGDVVDNLGPLACSGFMINTPLKQIFGTEASER
ncbi:MAG: hypothetical protein CFH41_02702 [Alphaproteobacteria bacterium MarineAlpha11_Bin1]|nr:MAG: hypothetical protein CFH41_02702 [Alphaproteobacteria bacterium MarineAlpha11_Bin1]